MRNNERNYAINTKSTNKWEKFQEIIIGSLTEAAERKIQTKMAAPHKKILFPSKCPLKSANND